MPTPSGKPDDIENQKARDAEKKRVEARRIADADAKRRKEERE